VLKIAKGIPVKNLNKKNKSMTLAAAAFAISVLGSSVAMAQEACVSTGDNSGIHVEPLLAGQTIDAGSVSAEVVGSDLVVTFSTSNGWELVEAHLWAGADLTDMPQTRKGNPKIGNFPYNSGDITGATEQSFAIPLAVLGYSCPSPNEDFYLAAHASLRKPDGSGGFQTETGWADGDLFVQRGSWATFSTITLSCDCDNGGGGGDPGSCETAFAFGGSGSACFLDIDEDGDGRGDFNRWGWTTGPLSAGSYEYPIYAGAGQCDISKGTHSGTLQVSYDGLKAVVTFEMFESFSMNEIHLYVGSEILARDVNNEFTVAPGQYPEVVDGLDGSTLYTVEVDISGPIYVVAHSVVCF
jgi:hypothetical protein